jgi:predicted DNA-binding transcriptional regulator AlpA
MPPTGKKGPEKKPPRRTPLPAAVVGLLNRRQVCEALGGISERKLSQMVSSGEFPRSDVRLGQLVRWSVPLVNQWCEDQRAKGPGR